MSADYCHCCGDWDCAAVERMFARPSLALEHHAEAILALAARYGISDVRVFGSCVTGADDSASDINLIGVAELGLDYFDRDRFVARVEELTGYPVDFVIDGDERPPYLDEVETVPLIAEPTPGITAEDFGPAPWSLIVGFKSRRAVLVADLAARGWLGIGADDESEVDR
ncbi:hypothetical protein [Microbacterium binotii]|uniref:Nucleotidyltransferase domain-containing protein n=1 Tax=Microbacterium binotii TaxID=462710 RepID=A0ABN3P762_9MICO